MEPTFEIEDMLCKLGKLSNNIEKHGDEDVISWAIPIKDMALPVALEPSDIVNGIAGDECFTRSIFNNNKGFFEPMRWVRMVLPFPEKYENAVIRLRLQSGEELEFHGCRVGDIEVTPVPGNVKLEFQIQLQPGLARENLLLQECQNHEIRITVLDARVAKKKTKGQQNLPLQQPKETAAATPEDVATAKRNAELEDKIRAELKKLASVGAKVPSDEDFALFKAYKAQHEDWGALAVVLRDLNIADQFIHECIDLADEQGDSLAVRLGKVLLNLGHEARSLIAKIP